jgi:cyanamide hydratase
MAITKQQFPTQASTLSPSTWALACLLHDIGTSEQNHTATRMSFDLYGGIKALDVLNGFGAAPDQAEAVAEAIIRHQDIAVHGTITYIGQLIQLATIYDNVGVHSYVKDFGELIHDTTRARVHAAHPPGEWRSFFSGVIQKEETIKPWCHTKKMVNVMSSSKPAS